MKATNFKKAVSFFALASAFTMTSCQKEELVEEKVTPAAIAEATSSTNIEGQYIVVFKNSSENTSQLIDNLISAKAITRSSIKDKIEGNIKGFNTTLTSVQLQELRNNPNVVSIEQDQIISLNNKEKGTILSSAAQKVTKPTGTMAGSLTVKTGETIPEGVAMVGYGDGTGRTAWVIDSGVDTTHPDLNVDVARSKSFLSSTTSVKDGYGHGTMVAGIIGAKNNGVGYIGVAANATIVALRVLDDAGNGTLTALIKAVSHVTTYGKSGDVVNISIGASASTTLDSYVKKLAAKGIYVTIAAGNSGADCSNSSPQRVNATNVYTVSMMDYNRALVSWSNFGAPVDRSAPGFNIKTTGKNGTYTYGHGTSFAAPHVAGLLLLKGNAMGTNGYITGDKDSWPDPVAKL